jgi:hypothetical protein
MADYMMRRRDQGPPSPFRERLRFAMLFVSFLAALVIVFAFWDGDPGGAVLLAAGWFLLDWGVVDLIWLRTGDVERVWLKTREGSRNVALLRVTAGAALIAIGVLQLV